MNSIYYALSVFAILYVIWWCMENERNDPDPDGDKGLLAMRAPEKPEKRANGARFRAALPDDEPSGTS